MCDSLTACLLCKGILHYITLHYRHFKCHLHLTSRASTIIHVIRNTAHRPSLQASYTASRVRPKRKISCAAAQIAATQIAATLTIYIISSMAPHAFYVVLRTTLDEFNVIPRTGLCKLITRANSFEVCYTIKISILMLCCNLVKSSIESIKFIVFVFQKSWGIVVRLERNLWQKKTRKPGWTEFQLGCRWHSSWILTISNIL